MQSQLLAWVLTFFPTKIILFAAKKTIFFVTDFMYVNNLPLPIKDERLS